MSIFNSKIKIFKKFSRIFHTNTVLEYFFTTCYSSHQQGKCKNFIQNKMLAFAKSVGASAKFRQSEDITGYLAKQLETSILALLNTEASEVLSMLIQS